MPTRREFLKAGLAAGAGLALMPLLAGCGKGRWGGAPRVAVVGAGLAGLACAADLRRAGIRATVIEAAERVGGRVLTNRSALPDAQQLELGGAWLGEDDEQLLALARDLDLELTDVQADAPALAEPLALVGGAVLRPDQLAAALASVPAAVAALAPADADRLSLAEWLAASTLPPITRQLLATAATARFGREPGELAAGEAWLVAGGAAALTGGGRWRLRDGNEGLARGLVRRLDDGQLDLGATLEAVQPRPGGGHRLALRRGGAAAEVDCDVCVLALPAACLPQVRIDADLPPALRAACAVGAGASTQLAVAFATRPWREAGPAGRPGAAALIADLPWQTAVEATRGQPGRGGALLVRAGGAAARALASGEPVGRALEVVDGLERHLPGHRGAFARRAVRFAWHEQATAGGGIASAGPGARGAFRAFSQGGSGSLLFAGEHCAGTRRGSMEGAYRSGQATAAMILAEG